MSSVKNQEKLTHWEFYGIVNDNETKDEQYHLLHLEAKWAVVGRVVQKMEILDF